MYSKFLYVENTYYHYLQLVMKSINPKSILVALSAIFTLVSCGTESTPSNSAFTVFDPEIYDERLNFYVIADSGRNGYYEQKPVAELMGELAAYIEPEFVVSAGDTHHFMGVESVEDPLWLTNFEHVYSHPELMVPFLPVLGNHEYQGDTESVISYSEVSRRWQMPSRYYTTVVEEAGTTMRLIFVDTAPLIDKYREDSEKYPDAVEQDMDEQLEWIESVLKASTERWVVVVGHHPIYAYTTKSIEEREDMQARLDRILRQYGVDLYICGHIHSFQHLRAEGSDIDYVVNGSASLARDVKAIEGTQFCAGKEGFLTVSANDQELETSMINSEGVVLYQFVRK